MRTATFSIRATALASVLTLLLVGVAQADGFVDRTRIGADVSPGRFVSPGTTITISGELAADHAFCRNGSEVTLRRFGSHGNPSTRIDSDTTADGGGYSFDVDITEQGKYRVWFRGKVGGVHPDIDTCRKSRSRVLRIFLT